MKRKSESRLYDLQALWSITDLLQKSKNLEEVLDVALAQVMQILKVEAGTMWIVGDSGKFAYPYVTAGPNVKQLKNMKLIQGEGMAGWVIENRLSQIIADVKNDERWTSRFDDTTGFTTKSILCVPLETQKSCIGCIQLINKKDNGEFTQEDLKLCEDIAIMIALAIEKNGFHIKDIVQKDLLIKLDNVSKNYFMGEVVVEALKDVSIELYKGELVVILGTSGSGKSTLLNLLGGMDTATKGSIMINNRDLTKAKDAELTNYRRHDIGFVFQFYNLIPDLTAFENVHVAAELAKDSLEIEEVLKEVNMYEKKDHFPAQMSGGEQQRVSIARALVKKPSILLCDEPTGALDNATGKNVIAILEKISRKMNNTVIIVTHNPAFAAMADRVIKMRSGKIIEIINNPNPLSAEGIEW